MRDGFVTHAASGVLGGAMGALILEEGARRARRLPARLQPPPIRRDPADLVVSRIEELRGRPLRRGVHEAVARSLQWGYYAAWGGALGLLVARRRVRTVRDALLSGAALGTLVWGASYGALLPAARLTPPLHRQGGRHLVAALLGHVAYGIASALPILALDRFVRPEPTWRRWARARR